jgi:hypothetical protein
MGELKWFLLLFFGLWVLWVLTGGPERVENRQRPFIEQPSPIEGGRTYTVEELKNKR